MSGSSQSGRGSLVCMGSEGSVKVFSITLATSGICVLPPTRSTPSIMFSVVLYFSSASLSAV